MLILYSINDRWRDECGALIEWYWQEKTESIREKSVLVPRCPPQLLQPERLVSNCLGHGTTMHHACLTSFLHYHTHSMQLYLCHTSCKYDLTCEHNYMYIVIKWGNIFQAVCSIWGGSSPLWHNCNSAWQNWAFQTSWR